MARLRDGGLAIFIAGPAEMLGLVVTTERLVLPGEVIILPNGRRFSNGGSPRWLIHSERICVRLSDGAVIEDYSLCFAHWLMPIDGDDFSMEDERAKEFVDS